MPLGGIGAILGAALCALMGGPEVGLPSKNYRRDRRSRRWNDCGRLVSGSFLNLARVASTVRLSATRPETSAVQSHRVPPWISTSWLNPANTSVPMSAHSATSAACALLWRDRLGRAAGTCISADIHFARSMLRASRARAPSVHAAVKQLLTGLQPACARCVMSGWIMNTNHKWLLATVFFWAIGTYFFAAGLVNPAVRMDPPFENDR